MCIRDSCYTYYMLSSPGLAFLLLGELGSGSVTDGALCGSRITFINITTYLTYILCHNFFRCV